MLLLEKIKRYFLGLIELLNCRFGGENEDDDDAGSDDGDDDGEDGEEEGEDDDDGDEGDEDEGDEDGDDDEDGDADSDNNGGKKRSKYVPRSRFDKVNTKAQKLDTLMEMGILSEDANGEIRFNPEALKPDEGQPSAGGGDQGEFYFKESDVDKGSWPLVQKINKGWDHMNKMANTVAFYVAQLQAENAILRDYPEFLQKENPLRKTSMKILKDDPEFKTGKYKADPQRAYWAVKRAAERLAGGKPPKKGKKSKSGKFIVGKGDTGKSQAKKVPIGSLTAEKLDELERAEHDRLQKLRNQK